MDSCNGERKPVLKRKPAPARNVAKRKATGKKKPVALKFTTPIVTPANEEFEETRKKAEDKVDTFFQSVFSSDDEDSVTEPKSVSTETNIPTYNIRDTSNDSGTVVVAEPSVSNKLDLPSTSNTSNTRNVSNDFEKNYDEVLLFADSLLNDKPATAGPQLGDMKSLNDFRKETEELLKNVSCLVDEFKCDKKKEETKKVEDSPNKSVSCPVCLEPLSSRPAVSTVCGHLFCKECILKVVKEQKKCPTCRKVVNHKKYHTIYL